MPAWLHQKSGGIPLRDTRICLQKKASHWNVKCPDMTFWVEYFADLASSECLREGIYSTRKCPPSLGIKRPQRSSRIATRSGKLNLRTGTVWRLAFSDFSAPPPGPYDAPPGKWAKLLIPVIVWPITVRGGTWYCHIGTRISPPWISEILPDREWFSWCFHVRRYLSDTPLIPR